MIFFGIDDYSKKKPSRLFTELQVNGQTVETDDDDNTPTDYTSGDDEGATTTPPPADDTPESNPEDYTVPDEDEPGADDQGNQPADPTATAATDTTPADAGDMGGGEGTAPADYTAGDTVGGGDDIGGGDTGGDTPPEGGDMGGEGTPPTDYTGAEGGEGGDAGGGGEGGEGGGGGEGGEGGGDTGGDTAPSGDTGGYMSGGSSGGDDELKSLQDDLFDSLTDEQIAIKDKELKNNFISLYDTIEVTCNRVNDISKSTSMIKPLEFIAEKLNDLSDQVSDYLTYTYKTKTYPENMIMFNLFMHSLSAINDMLSSIDRTTGL